MARRGDKADAPGGAEGSGGSGAPYEYQRIENMLRDRIARKELLPGDRIESEYELAERLGVHRFTVNKAVSTLVREGLLYRVKGRGTFVTEKLLHEKAGSGCIGVLFTSTMETLFASWFNSQVLSGVRSATAKDVLLFGGGPHSKGRGPEFDKVAWDKVEGVVLLEIFSREYLRDVIARGVPLVVVDYEDPELDVDCVVLDNLDAGRIMTRHLVELGHRRIAHIGEGAGVELPDPAWQDRRRGWEEVLREAGLERRDEYFVPLKYRWASDRNEEIAALFRLDEPPTAVTCADDELAFTTMRIAAKMGLEIPGDFSIVGFGGSDASELTTPTLTTVRASYHQMGRVAMDLLQKRIDSPGSRRSSPRIPVELIVRDSTGEAPP